MTGQFESAAAAEAAFYTAFEDGDLDAMMAVWADSPGIVCVHPMSQPLSGCAAVRASWAQIFASGQTVSIGIDLIAETVSVELAVRVVHERIRVTEAGGGHDGIVLATNAYRRLEGGWRMVLHHASPLPEQRAGRGVAVH
jgi:ketosteroid isomerase-like protein